MEKNLQNSIIEVIGTILTDENGKIKFKSREFDKTKKYSVTFKVAEDSEWAVLSRQVTFVTVDCLDERDFNALSSLNEKGEINKATRLVAIGYLVKTPGKPGMNDFYNLKKKSFRLAKENEHITVNFDEALTKEEWQVIRSKKNNSNAPVAPSAPVAPAAPF